MNHLRVQASARMWIEAHVAVSSRHQTLFYGLKKNHAHNAALIHPVIFMARRIIYSAVIIFMF